MALETLANWIVDLSAWGIAILVIMLIWEVFSAFGLMKSGKDEKWENSSVAKWIKKRGRVGKTKALRQYIREEKEEDLLDDATATARDALTLVEATLAKKKIDVAVERDKLKDALKNVGKKLSEAKRNFRKVKRETWRNDQELDKLLKKMDEQEIETKEIKALERNILKLHRESIQGLDNAISEFGKISGEIRIVGGATVPEDWSGSPTPFAAGSVPDALTKIKSNLEQDVYLLKEAYDKQAEAKKEAQGIISKTRELWK